MRCAFFEVPWTKALAEAGRAVQRGDYAAARGAYEEALAAAADAGAAGDPATGAALLAAHCNLACIYSLLSAGKESPAAEAQPISLADARAHRDRAFEHLGKAIDLGWKDAAPLAADTDLAPLRDDPRWKPLLKRLE